MENKMRIRRTLTVALLLVMAVLVGVFLWTGHEVRAQLHEYQAARSEYAQLRERFGIVGSVTSLPEDADSEESLNFDALLVLNPGIVGWIVVPGTEISYPIVQGTDNERYLWHTISGERNNSGAIFLDYRNAVDFSDPLTIVYGHNMRDGSMFAPLHGWDGDYFIVHTPCGTMLFEVFDRQLVQENDALYQLCHAPRDNGAWVVMLSTCVFVQSHLRYVIRGRLWDKFEVLTKWRFLRQRSQN